MLLRKIENTTQEQTEQILAQELSLPINCQSKSRTHYDESVTLTVTSSKAQIEILSQAQDLIAYSVPEKNWSAVIAYLARKEVSRRTEIRGNGKRRIENKPTIENERTEPQKTLSENITEAPDSNVTSPMKVQRKALRPNLRKSVLHAKACCHYKEFETGKICGSERFL